MAENALRVLAMGYKEFNHPLKEEDMKNLEKDLIYIGMVGMIDPPRIEVKDAVSKCKKAGIRTVMITGDHKITAVAIAKELGILNEGDWAITGNELEKMSDEDLEKNVKNISVYARVSPEHKVRIVKAWQANKEVVAMTGDGVNDILAMKDADCSISMAAGSDAAIQASQVVLMDSDFSKMPRIVAEGRRNINNIQRTATLFLVKNIFSLLLALFSIISVLTYPLQPSQITMVSLVNIGIPGFFLALEPNNKRISGNFLVKVLLKAMPAALTDFFAIAALVVFGNTFGVKPDDISVASTFLLAIVGFIILANISAPLNSYRLKVLLGCVLIMIIGAFLFHDLFSINYVSTECVMLFVLFAIATEPFMRYLTRLFTFIEKKFTKKCLNSQ
jgi:cation-transporting ATPase E